MEKGQTRKEQIFNLEAEITSLTQNLASLDSERSALSYKNAEGKMTNGDYRRVAEVENLISAFSAQKKAKEAEVRRLRHEDIIEIQRLTDDSERKNAEAYSKGEPEHSNDKSGGNGYKAALISILAVIAVGVTLIALNLSKNKGGSILPEPSPAATATLDPKVLFGDVSNPKDVSKRVEYIYNTELSAFLNQLGDPFTTNANQEDLEDMIRVMSGELPINSNYEGNATVDKFAGLLWDVYGNYGSTPKKLNKLYPVTFSSLVESADDETINFISRYDKVYNDIIKYRNENNSEKVIENIILLGQMQNDDVRLSGLYSGYSPTDVDQRYQLLAIASVQARYESIVLEYLESNHLTICIPVCVDAETGKVEEHNVISIFQAIRDGISKDGKLRTTADGKVVVWSEEFYKNLCQMLKDKSETQKLIRK